MPSPHKSLAVKPSPESLSQVLGTLYHSTAPALEFYATFHATFGDVVYAKDTLLLLVTVIIHSIPRSARRALCGTGARHTHAGSTHALGVVTRVIRFIGDIGLLVLRGAGDTTRASRSYTQTHTHTRALPQTVRYINGRTYTNTGRVSHVLLV